MRSLRESGQMSVHFGVGLACKLAVASVGRTMIVLDSCRFFDVVGDHCMMEDRVDHCSS